MDLELAGLIRTALGESCQELDMNSSFVRNGGDSLKAISLASACRSAGFGITREMILTLPSLNELLQTPGLSASTSTLSTMSTMSTPSTAYSYLDDSPTNDSPLVLSVPELTPLPSRAQSPTRDLALKRDPCAKSSPPSRFPAKHEELPAGLFLGPANSTRALDGSEAALTSEGPLTEMQMSMVHGTLSDGTANVIFYKETYYTDDVPAVRSAWARVIQSEPIFHEHWLRSLGPDGVRAFNWEETTAEASDATLAARYQGRIGSFFEVSPSGAAKHGRPLSTVTWIVHHAFIDGFSSQLVFGKVRRAANGLGIQPGPSFWDWSRFLRRYQQHRKSDGDEFWSSKADEHAEAKGELLLPPPVEREDSAPDSAAVEIDSCSFQVGDIAAPARELGVTPAAVFYAAWALVLASYADSDDVVFGAVLGGRNLPIPGSIDVVGPTLNVLPLHVALQRDAWAKDFVSSLSKDIVELEKFSWTTPSNGFSRQYESALSVQMVADESRDYAVQPLETSSTQVSEVPLSIMVNNGTGVTIQYHKARFSRENIERVSQCYSVAIELLLRAHLKVGTVMEGLLSPSSNRTLMRFGNCYSGLTNWTSIKTDLVMLFEKCVREYPDYIAVEKESVRLSYRDLDLAASRVARKLSFISPGDVVCVHADKTINWIVTIFGILKAGGVYSALDAALPAKLRQSMFGLAGAKAFITPAESQLTISPAPPESSFSTERILQEASDEEEPMEHRKVPRSSSPAYICFTSGSTGTPKGVVCTHAGLVAFQSDLEVRLYAQPGVRVSQIMSVAFDGSIHEIFSSLTHGATLVLPGGADPLGPLESVDSALLTPSIARVLNPDDFPKLKSVYVVGEPVPQSVNDIWASKKKLFNMYGPTEATCGATIKRLRPREPVTIGGPNPTTRVYILNSRRDLCHPGMVGEIFLAGVQVSRGYLNLPEQTNQRFHQDSVMGNLEMMYQTGDRGYWSEAGEVVCLGRNDRQIKLRGYRLDMNDLEIRVARAVPSLKAVAIARRGDELICMVQPASVNTVDLRRQLSSVLAHYAMPHHFIAVDDMPMTKAGKIDYKAVIQHKITPTEDETPATPAEKTAMAAYRAVLNLADNVHVSRNSHFTSLGGHSLAQIRLASRLSAELHTKVPLQLVLAHPTVQTLASEIDKLLATSAAMTSSKKTLGNERVSPIEQEWLDKYELGRGTASFNVSVAADFDEGSVDLDRLTEAWNTVLSRYPLFRSRYAIQVKQQTAGRIYASHPPRVEVVTGLDLWSELNRPFELERESPVRIFLSKNQLLIVMSHIVADYTTMSVLLKEASALYLQKPLSPVRRTYSDVSVWYEPALPASREFWTEYLGDYREQSSSMAFLGRRREGGYSGESVFYVFEEAAARKIMQYAQSSNVTLQQMALGAVALVLEQNQPKTDVVLGLPYMNRQSEEDAETVGLFLEPMAVRIRYGQEEEPEAASFMAAVKESVQSAVAHAMPWHQLLEALSITPEYPSHPIFDVMVTFHDSAMVQGLAMPGLPQLRSRYVWSQGAKFKLMAEFMRLGEAKLLLRVEYDNGCISAPEMERLIRDIPLSMVSLAEGMQPAEVKERFATSEGRTGGIGSAVEAEEMFGVRLCDLR